MRCLLFMSSGGEKKRQKTARKASVIQRMGQKVMKRLESALVRVWARVHNFVRYSPTKQRREKRRKKERKEDKRTQGRYES